MDQHALQIVPHVQCVNAQSCNALRREPPIPRVVALRVVAQLVRKSINLDSEQRLVAIEVEYEGAGRMLATEFKPIWTLAEQVPERCLRRTQPTPQLPRLCD